MTNSLHLKAAAFLFLASSSLHAADAWWNKDWTQRQKITLDSSALGGSAGECTLLVRISDGSLFAGAREDGGDLRFVSVDGKTQLPQHIERYDSLLGEAFVWVKVPEVKSGADALYLYFGNPNAPTPGKPVDAYSSDLAAVYHFSETGSPAADSTTNGNNASGPGIAAEGAIIGSGLRLSGTNTVAINTTESLAWTAGGPLAISLWIKPTASQSNAVILSRGEAKSSFKFLLDQGVPVVEITNGGAPIRSQGGAPITAGSWNHITVVADGSSVKLFANGETQSTAATRIPALNGPITLGASLSGLTGEIDELRISKSPLSPAEIKLAFINQGGTEVSQKLLSTGTIEGGEAGKSHIIEHLMLFGDIANNMMFDGWIAIGVCVIMIVVGWTVAIRKYFYLNKIERGNQEFLQQWKALSTDLTALDHSDTDSVRNLGGTSDDDEQEAMKDSPLYQIYHIGSEEIRHRIDKSGGRTDGLSSRSIQAIRASLDTGMVHENHRLTDGLVFLTISIAGGPYVGLLGTVVGVMITFAIIAKSGEVNVNSIAPGIASALLATVVGLIVAIPALFIYSYLNSRIKKVVSTMQVFIDEFVAKMAEFHRPKNDPAAGDGYSI